MKQYGANKGELKSGVFRPTGSYAFEHPTGTGPFKFVSWKVGEKVELAENKALQGRQQAQAGQDHRPSDLDRHWSPPGAPVR